MKQILLAIVLVILLSSCKSIEMALYPNNYIPRDTPIEKEYIYDTVRIVNDGGIINDAIAGYKPTKQLTFTKIGQSYTFKSGESLEIISNGIDFSYSTFDIETNEETKEIRITLIDKDISKVLLVSKCQTIVRTGINFVPKIEVASGLDPEQIVVTPMFDDSCNRIGYQIRYGSEERGCRKQAADVLERFKRCTGPKTPPSGGISEKCRIRKKLGLPCK